VTPEARHLRVLDGHGEVTVRDDLTPIPSEVADLKDVIVTIQRQLAHARGELTKLRAADPDHETIVGLLERWQRSHPRAKIPAEGKRWAAVKKALMVPYSAEDIEAVIDTVRDHPWESYGVHYPEPAPGRKRRDDITYALANEVRVDYFLRIARGQDPDGEPRTAYKRALWARLQADAGLRRALASLGPEPRADVIAGACRWAMSAPSPPRPPWYGNPS